MSTVKCYTLEDDKLKLSFTKEIESLQAADEFADKMNQKQSYVLIQVEKSNGEIYSEYEY